MRQNICQFASKHLSGSINSRYTDNLLEDVDYEIRSSNNSKRIMTDRKSFVAEVGKHGKKIEQNSISQKEGDGQKDCIEGLQVVDYEDEGSIFSQQTQQINQKQSIFTPSVEQKSMNYNIKPIVYQKAKENGVEKYGVIVYDTNKISKSAMSSKKLQKEERTLDNTANVNQLKLKNSQQPEMKYKVLQTNVVDYYDNAKNNKRIVLEQSSNDNINMGELGRLLIGDVRDPISKQNRPKTGTVVRQLQSYSNDTNILFQSRKSASNGSRIGNVYVN